MPEPTHCQSCNAPLRWATTQKGKRMPLNAEPDPGGNVALLEGGLLAALTATEIEAARRNGVPLYLSHFATCTHAPHYRRR